MKIYVGTKIIKAELSNLAEYKKKKYGELAVINEGDNEIKCYIVTYPPISENDKEYMSMSPKDVFEKYYREIYIEEIKIIASN